MEAILMCRVSDPKQEDKYSLDAQEREGREYARTKRFTLRPEKFQFQETASKPQQRKKFDEIIALIYKRTEAKGSRIALLVEKHDRLLRNHEDSAEIQRLVVAGRLEVHFFKFGKVLNKTSDPSEFLINDVMTSVNTFQARTIGVEAIKGMVEKARQGWFPNKAPLGYVNIDRDVTGKRSGRDARESIIVPNPDRRFFIWVVRMFELAADGHSIREIRRRCLDEGLVPAERVATFSKSLIEATLKNPFYAGRFVWREVEYEGKHELIVPAHILARVQARARGDTKRKRKHDGALVGWLRCGECGCSITFEPKTKASGLRFDYYRCSNGKGLHQKSRYVTEQEILRRFEPALDSITLTEVQAQQVTDALNAAHYAAKEAKQRQMEGFRAQLKDLEKAEDELYVDMKRGVLDEDSYKRQLTRVRSERQRFTTLLEQAQQAVDGAYLRTAQATLELATRAKSLWLSRNAADRRQLLEKLLQNPVLDAVSVRYEMKKPFRVIAKMTQNGDQLPILDSRRTRNPLVMRLLARWDRRTLGLERTNKRRLRSMILPPNPVERGLIYDRAMRAGQGLSYADVAERFGVTRIEVCHYVTIIRRLPADLVEHVRQERNPRRLRKLSLRALLRVARLGSAAEKRHEFERMVH